MKAKIIHSYVDNKIRQAVAEKKSASEVIEVLRERVMKNSDPTDRGERAQKLKDYLIEFSLKRIDDIKFVSSKKEFNKIPNNKLLNLIQLKDKLQMVELDFDL